MLQQNLPGDKKREQVVSGELRGVLHGRAEGSPKAGGYKVKLEI